ncbi:SGNH/GDSL hydrolase family protein [uncultured Rikenella sp.]|uniref:SGNH/GDSL hydrolase family protein n=1 Tax=uncultured Rikenella sp. TaxID=368003 RepID=UPI0025E515E9|nr:SGNH/GDSL hydrolase family protein [uncultured Rikenella sp.]
MKQIQTIFLSLLAAGSFAVRAQSPVVWHDPLAAADTETDYIHGRGFRLNDYTRLPESARHVVREAVWSLSRNSAGLYLQFITDSPEITVQYEVTGAHAMPHMPATGVSGVDLYNGRGERCWGSYSFGHPIAYTYRELPDTAQATTYTLYLPLYNTVRELKIGVREGSAFEFVPRETQLPIVVYGTSIAQGACASRPGMAWTNLLQRMTERPVVNLGFSGNGRLEPEMIGYVTSIPAALYVVDCMPNMYVPEDSIYTLVMNAVRQFRQTRPETPILLVEHPGYANRQTNAAKRGEDGRADRAQRRAFADLRREGIKGLHYLSRREIGMPADGMVDYIHPSDYGMEAYAQAYRRAVEKILKRKSR